MHTLTFIHERCQLSIVQRAWMNQFTFPYFFYMGFANEVVRSGVKLLVAG